MKGSVGLRAAFLATACAVLTAWPTSAVGARKTESGSRSARFAASGAWVTKAPMPTARHEPSIGVLNGLVYVAGGYGGGQLSTLEAYDPATDTWASKAPRPAVGSSKAYGVVGGVLYETEGVNCCVEVNSTFAFGQQRSRRRRRRRYEHHDPGELHRHRRDGRGRNTEHAGCPVLQRQQLARRWHGSRRSQRDLRCGRGRLDRQHDPGELRRHERRRNCRARQPQRHFPPRGRACHTSAKTVGGGTP